MKWLNVSQKVGTNENRKIWVAPDTWSQECQWPSNYLKKQKRVRWEQESSAFLKHLKVTDTEVVHLVYYMHVYKTSTRVVRSQSCGTWLGNCLGVWIHSPQSPQSLQITRKGPLKLVKRASSPCRHSSCSKSTPGQPRISQEFNRAPVMHCQNSSSVQRKGFSIKWRKPFTKEAIPCLCWPVKGAIHSWLSGLNGIFGMLYSQTHNAGRMYGIEYAPD